MNLQKILKQQVAAAGGTVRAQYAQTDINGLLVILGSTTADAYAAIQDDDRITVTRRTQGVGGGVEVIVQRMPLKLMALYHSMIGGADYDHFEMQRRLINSEEGDPDISNTGLIWNLYGYPTYIDFGMLHMAGSELDVTLEFADTSGGDNYTRELGLYAVRQEEEPEHERHYRVIRDQETQLGSVVELFATTFFASGVVLNNPATDCDFMIRADGQAFSGDVLGAVAATNALMNVHTVPQRELALIYRSATGQPEDVTASLSGANATDIDLMVVEEHISAQKLKETSRAIQHRQDARIAKVASTDPEKAEALQVAQQLGA